MKNDDFSIFNTVSLTFTQEENESLIDFTGCGTKHSVCSDKYIAILQASMWIMGYMVYGVWQAGVYGGDILEDTII